MDTLLTVAGLVVFVYLAYRVGKVLNAFKHRRFTRAWQPLIGIINGKVLEDPQGGGASSWLAGQWKGKTIHARMTPDVRTVEKTSHHNQFAAGVAQLKGRFSWRASRGFSLSGAAPIEIDSQDESLAARLRAAGVAALLEQAKCEAARFDAHSGYLFVEEDVSPEWIPPPERFVVLLDLAVELARIQEAANAA